MYYDNIIALFNLCTNFLNTNNFKRGVYYLTNGQVIAWAHLSNTPFNKRGKACG